MKSCYGGLWGDLKDKRDFDHYMILVNVRLPQGPSTTKTSMLRHTMLNAVECSRYMAHSFPKTWIQYIYHGISHSAWIDISSSKVTYDNYVPIWPGFWDIGHKKLSDVGSPFQSHQRSKVLMWNNRPHTTSYQWLLTIIPHLVWFLRFSLLNIEWPLIVLSRSKVLMMPNKKLHMTSYECLLTTMFLSGLVSDI